MLGLNKPRKAQLLELMKERGWDLLLLYGDAWRKEHFRTLVNENFSGPNALVTLHASGEMHALVSHPWDLDLVAPSVNGKTTCAPSFAAGLRTLVPGKAKTAIAGKEQMEARFVHAVREAADQSPSPPRSNSKNCAASKAPMKSSASSEPVTSPTAAISVSPQ